MSNKPKHTEGPWESYLLVDEAEVRAKGCVVADIHCGKFSMGDGTGHVITIEECHANADFIVKACNNYYQLLEACKAAYNHLHGNPNIPAQLCVDLKQALAKAEGKE